MQLSKKKNKKQIQYPQKWILQQYTYSSLKNIKSKKWILQQYPKIPYNSLKYNFTMTTKFPKLDF